ncbi:long-chain fatty acid transport protein 6 isoform X3 [Dunckerocampus dactyliophorus]|uniref:long-chain fatty acid transport protein 6 isoform X3 n=1 Tax=Dunckerocampus dactyliophorus TaxID=161453 RepID=UPI002404C182|nr:long-chain fatty acid transport protein 6 isoform X3 [Dunckerocampus dactyliophorus]
MLTAAFTILAGLLAVLAYQKVFNPFLWVDLRYYLKLRMYRKSLQARAQQGIITFLDGFLLQVRRNPNKAFIIYEDQRLTYQDVDRRSNQFANLFREMSLKQGDIVALLMCNEPDFMSVWLGLCKLGCQVAFLNTNNKSKSVLHCIQTCGAKALVVGTGLVHLAEDLLPALKKDNMTVFVVHHTAPSEDFVSLLDKMENSSTERQSGLPKVDIMSNFLFIFTSGTTGLPKAACVSHLKAIMSMAFFQMCGATSDDVIYITLPLYHMSASLLGIGGAIQLGATCVLKKKFSAGQFWKDCVKYNVTVVQYIGELCRYLVTHPRLLTPFELLRYDTQTYEPLRTASGRCVRAQKGEAGILVAPLTPMNQFLGYAGNKVQSEKKLVKDVFRMGDVYFNTGDLLLQDQRDFLYFCDRVGDTFRWKGENVSTMEVSDVLCLLDFIQEASVYGVTIPGHEGRAGMAAIVLKPDHRLNGPELYRHLVEALPPYAWPWFLRIRPSLDVTETFKQQKGKLVQEGFNPDITLDPLFFLDITQKDYILINGSLYENIVLGKIKL